MSERSALAATRLCDSTVRLTPWALADAQDLLAAVRESVAGVGHWLPWCTPDYGPTQAEQWVATCRAQWRVGAAYAFAIRAVDGGALLGSCGLNQLDHKHCLANLGYWVRSAAQGRGTATAAAQLVAAFGFRELGLARIEIVTLTDNLASRRVAVKLGARHEGVARHRLWAWNRAHDAAVYGLLPGDLAD
ncbi:MAG: N-acetyltransferase [Rhodanobacter sp.]|nr:MAG: N-acetyltransferase [Rhodanobacter sp.]TAM12056.1 MAG: N-acetyltransferase [Rhodanobacter sp.]TAM34602.1 MAG: N-acetyltransferase [Rhodanobacter sp.]